MVLVLLGIDWDQRYSTRHVQSPSRTSNEVDWLDALHCDSQQDRQFDRLNRKGDSEHQSDANKSIGSGGEMSILSMDVSHSSLH